MKRVLIGLGVFAWVAGAVGGMYWFNAYSNTPGATALAVPTWPTGGQIQRSREVSTLVVALHPECPCSRATVSELRSVATAFPASFEILFLFAASSPDRRTEDSDLFKSAQTFKAGRLIPDTESKHLSLFGFQTSGEVRLYRTDGQLVFSGGITGSRGHAGDNPGRRTLIAAIEKVRRSDLPTLQTTPVFGCSLN